MSSRGKGEDFETKLETDRSKRFDFLLKQTEIFSHFMTTQAKGTPKPKAGRPRKIKPEEHVGPVEHVEPTEPMEPVEPAEHSEPTDATKDVGE